jgi:hypothetical protein
MYLGSLCKSPRRYQDNWAQAANPRSHPIPTRPDNVATWWQLARELSDEQLREMRDLQRDCGDPVTGPEPQEWRDLVAELRLHLVSRFGMTVGRLESRRPWLGCTGGQPDQGQRLIATGCAIG